MSARNAREALAVAKKVWDDRRIWEATWDIVSRFVAPERATFFRKIRSPSEIQADVFDTTGIEAADDLVELLMTGLVPAWQKWFRMEPGIDVTDTAAQQQIAPELEHLRDEMLIWLENAGFYEAMQQTLLDRVVCGTGGMELCDDYLGHRFRNVPLADLAIQEDYAGRITRVVQKRDWSYDDLARTYGADKLPGEMRQAGEGAGAQGGGLFVEKYAVYKLDEQEVDGTWKHWTILELQATALEEDTRDRARAWPTRHSRFPGTPYGRGPGLRALSDIRMLNKLKELTVKNAAKAVAGVYTVVDDGVLNPYTLSFQPGATIPVASNSPNNPSIAELPNTSKFDTGKWSMEALAMQIRTIFDVEEFTPEGKTPLSATEVSELAKKLAKSLGATIMLLQRELLMPVLQMALVETMEARGLRGMKLDGKKLNVRFASELAIAMDMQNSQGLVGYATVVGKFGSIDPRAGFILDIPATLREVGRQQGVPARLLRSDQAIEGLMQKATAAQIATAQQSGTGVAVPGSAPASPAP